MEVKTIPTATALQSCLTRAHQILVFLEPVNAHKHILDTVPAAGRYVRLGEALPWHRTV